MSPSAAVALLFPGLVSKGRPALCVLVKSLCNRRQVIV